MDMGSIASAVSSLKAAGEIAKGLISLKTMAEVQSKAIELNQQIIDAQQQIFATNAVQTALVEKIRTLEGQVTRMKDWDAQKQRYKLAAPFPGCMVYALQKSMNTGETAHYLCASCFQKGESSILQGIEDRTGVRNAAYQCPVCKSLAFTAWANVTAPQYFEDIKPRE
jgi:cell division protein FtsB